MSMPSEPAARKSSKLWLGLGLGCALPLVLCCGGGIVLTYMAGRVAQEAASEDPGQISSVTAEIATIQLPEGMQPKAMIDLKVPILGTRMFTMVVYQDAARRGTFMLCRVPGKVEQMDSEQLRRDLEQKFKETGQEATGGDIVVTSSRKIEVTIGGKPAEFVIQTGENRQTNQEMVQAFGIFQAADGVGFLMFIGPAEQYESSDVEQLIRSVSVP